MSAKASWHQNYVTVTLGIVLLFPKMPASSKTHALLLLSFTNAIYWMSLKIGSLDKTNKNWNILWEIEKIISDWLSTVFFNFEIIALTENYYTRLTALCPGLTRWAGTRRQIKPIWILLKQETVSGSGISWDICKSAPLSRQIAMPAPHHSVFLQAGCPSCRPTNSVKALTEIV